MRFSLLLTLGASLFAQGATLTLTGPASALPGQAVTLTLTLAGTAGLNLSGFQFSLPPGSVLASPAVSPAGAAIGKGAYCGPAGCLDVGLSTATPPVVSNNPLSDGAALSVQLTIGTAAAPGVLALPLSGLLGASTAGVAIPITSGPAYSIRVLSKCDANGDGVTDFKDVQSVVAALNAGSGCPLAGGCTVVSLVTVLLAALGGACSL